MIVGTCLFLSMFIKFRNFQLCSSFVINYTVFMCKNFALFLSEPVSHFKVNWHIFIFNNN